MNGRVSEGSFAGRAGCVAPRVARTTGTPRAMGKLGALALAVALCLGLMPPVQAAGLGMARATGVSVATAAAPATAGVAWADEGAGLPEGALVAQDASTVGTATLVVVYGLGWDGSPQVKLNKSYSFYENATLEDLLKAAVAAGDIQAYALNSYGFLASITDADGTVMAGAADSTTYWASYENGAYYAGSDTVATERLADGTSYQFAWESYPAATAPVDWSVIPAPSEGSAPAGYPGLDGNENKAAPVSVDGTLCENLFNNIAASFAGATDSWKAMELAAAGKGANVDADGLVASVLAAAADATDTTAPQRGILGLTAMGIDATKVASSAGAVDLASQMATATGATNQVNGKVFALLAYASGPYEAPASALKTPDALIAEIAATQLADGGFAYSGSSADPDLTAMAIAALAPYAASNAQVSALMQDALVALKGLQNADGGFGGDWPAAKGATSANSTGMAVVALCAAGIDPSSSWATDAGVTPLGALLAQANDTQDGFLYKGQTNDLATEQGFRALVAYQGLANAGGAYNIYVQAKDASAALAPQAPQGGDAPSDAAFTKTSDNAAMPVAAGAVALCALATLAVASRRGRRPLAAEASTHR